VLEQELIRSFQPVVVSAARAFATVVQSDFGGQRSRTRLVLRGEPLPQWLRPLLPDFLPAGTLVVAARGRAPAGASTRISSIVVYPSLCGKPAQAFVYVEEWDTGFWTAEVCSPFHVIRCAPLPDLVRFVEVPRARAVAASRARR
jgi:hypothetical protein